MLVDERRSLRSDAGPSLEGSRNDDPADSGF